MTPYLNNFSPSASQISQAKKHDIRSWLPAIAWVLLPLSFSYINGFGAQPSGALTLRWLGLGVLSVYGFFNLVLSSRWRLTGFDYFACIVFSIIIFTSVIHSGLFGTLKAFSCLLVYLALTWGVGSLISCLRDATIITERFLGVSVIIIVIGLVGNLSGLIPLRGGAAAGISFNPNANAEMAAAFIPLAVWFMQHRKAKNIFWKAIRYSMLASLLIAVFISENRSSVVALSAFVIYSIFVNINYKTRDRALTNIFLVLLLGICTLGSVFLLNSLDFQNSWSQFVHENTDPASAGITANRTNLLWPLYGEQIKQAPLIGHGWGSEELLLRDIRASSFSYTLHGDAAGTAHSAYIGLTYQIGFIGSSLTFIPLWGMVFSYLKEASKIVSAELFRFRLALASSVLVILVFSMFETGLYNMGSTFAFPFWLFTYLLFQSKKWQH